MNNKTLSGIILVLISSLSLAVMGLFIRLLGDDLNNFTILFFRFFISTLVLLPIVKRKSNVKFSIKFPVLLPLRSIFGFMGIALYFYTIEKSGLTFGILLENTYPVFIPIVALILFRDKTNYKIIAGIIISFIGVYVINCSEKFSLNIGFITGILSGISIAISFLILQKMLKKDKEQFNNILLFYFVFCTLVPIVPMCLNWKPIGWTQALYLVLIGLFGTSFQYYYTKALKFISVKVAAPINYMSVIFASLLSYLVFGISITVSDSIGMIFIIFGGIFIILNTDKTAKV